MDGAGSTRIVVFIRIIGVVILISLFQQWPLMTFGLALVDNALVSSQADETFWAVIALGGAAVCTWMLGALSCVTLFMLKPASRWFVLGYFLLGLIPAYTPWLPYAGYLANLFDDPLLKVISLEMPNFIIVILTFLLFFKLAKLSKQQEIQKA